MTREELKQRLQNDPNWEPEEDLSDAEWKMYDEVREEIMEEASEDNEENDDDGNDGNW